jgi:hypothetical protein
MSAARDRRSANLAFQTQLLHVAATYAFSSTALLPMVGGWVRIDRELTGKLEDDRLAPLMHIQGV